MTSRFDIEDYPLLKLALPLIAGIIIGWQCDVDMLHVAALFVVAFLAVGAGLFRFAPRWLFGAGAVGVMLAVGLFSVTCERREAQPRWGKEKLSCEAQLLEVPYMGAASTRALAYVTARGALPGERSEGVVNIYFANSVEAEALRVGERLLFEAVIKNPANAGNPAEFDVGRYMRVKGVSGSLYLPVEGWESVGLGRMTLRMRALALRERVVRMYESLGFEGNNLSLLSAFSVGEVAQVNAEQSLTELFNLFCRLNTAPCRPVGIVNEFYLFRALEQLLHTSFATRKSYVFPVVMVIRERYSVFLISIVLRVE